MNIKFAFIYLFYWT